MARHVHSGQGPWFCRRSWWPWIALLWAVVASAPTRGAAQDLETAVDDYLAPYLETGNFSGSVLIGRNDQVVLAKAYGEANVETSQPNTVETAFHLASVSRVFTSAAVLLLAQRGLLSLDDPLSKYEPDWPRGGEITMHHLLSLSAGFPNINQLSGYWQWERSPQTPQSLVSKFRDLPLRFDPGDRTEHSNSNYNVLALIIETVSGKSFGDFLAQEMFAPLGMLRSGHDDGSNDGRVSLALGYRPVGFARLEPDRTIHWTVKTGNGSLYSTVEDIYRFDRMLAKASLLNEASIAELFTAHFPNHGYGWFLGERDYGPVVYINGRSPGFGAYWIRAVDPDVTVIVLGNIYNSAPSIIGDALLTLALGGEPDPPRIRAAKPDARVLESVAGSYQFGEDFYRPNARKTFRVKDGHLFDGDHWLMPADSSGRRFVHRVYWSTLVFRENGEGRIVDMTYDDFVGQRR